MKRSFGIVSRTVYSLNVGAHTGFLSNGPVKAS